MTTTLQRAAWKAHAITPRFCAKVDKSALMIRQHPTYAVSVSWGKDSVAMLHLACRTLGHVVAVHGRYSENEELPDIPAIRDEVLGLLGECVNYIEVPVWGDWEIFERAGRFFLEPETPDERAILKAWKAEFVAAIEGAAVAAGANGVMIGMSAHESHARRMNIAVRGDHYTASGRVPTLLPLARWSGDDVCAYHAANDLPWLRIYEQAEDPRRARSEFAFAAGGGDAIRRHGAWEAWRTAYPELWGRWQARWLGSNAEVSRGPSGPSAGSDS
jgi:3'-phosphoadenosine 5'-phosphosulfate sulfotransferase (PAPS reductase)/FAD synthetase